MVVPMRTSSSGEGRITRFVNGADRRTINVLFGVYFLLLFLTVMPPFFSVVNHVQPMIFGLSFMLFWTLFVGVMMALGLTVLYWVERERGEVV